MNAVWHRALSTVGVVALLALVVAGVLAIGRDTKSSRAAPARTNAGTTAETACAPTIVQAHDGGAAPTAAQRRAAQRLIDDTRAAVQPYEDIRTARRAGFRQLDPVHWYQPGWYADDATLDPTHPEFLMYDGERRLLGAMFVEHDGPGPQVGGPLTAWHTHCRSQMPCRLPGNVLLEPEDGRCRGRPQVRDWMLHVWLVPNRLGPFGHEMVAPVPPDTPVAAP
jgi:hypothetical protein